jgi:NADH-quinone oxidoreductase subunit M
MVNHGVTTGALFLLVGVLYDRRHTRELVEFGGIAKVMPVYAALFIVVTMASVGVPGTNGFIGEFMILAGTYASEALLNFGPVQAIGAGLGVILAAVYMLTAVQKVFFGPLSNPKNHHLDDITPREGLALAPLVVLVFVIGLFPALFTERMTDAVGQFTTQYRSAWATLAPLTEHGRNWHAARLLPEADIPKPFLKGAAPRSSEPPPPPTEEPQQEAAAPTPNEEPGG